MGCNSRWFGLALNIIFQNWLYELKGVLHFFSFLYPCNDEGAISQPRSFAKFYPNTILSRFYEVILRK